MRSPSLTESVPPLCLDDFIWGIVSVHGLTRREARILEHAAYGKASKEIAFALGISRRTVDYYWGRIFDKLGCRSQLEVMALMLSRATAPDDPTIRGAHT